MSKFVLINGQTVPVMDQVEFQAELFRDAVAFHDALEDFHETFKDYAECERVLDDISDLRSMIKANVPFDSLNKIYDLQKGLAITLEEFQSLDCQKLEATLEGNEKSVWQKIVDFIKDMLNRVKVAVMRFFNVGDKLYKKLLEMLDDIKSKKGKIGVVVKESYTLAPFEDIDCAYYSGSWTRDSAFTDLIVGTIGVVHARSGGPMDRDFYDGMTKYVQSFCDKMNKRRKDTASWDPETGTFEFDSTKLIDVKTFKTLEEAGYLKDIPKSIQGVVGAYVSWTKCLREHINNAKINAWPSFIERLLNNTIDKAAEVEEKQRLKSLIRCANSILSKTNSEMAKVEAKLIKTMSCLVSSIKVDVSE